jgi:Spy/CpxP family protein refolding chaperone
MKKLALTTLTVGLAAGLAVPALAETTAAPAASLTYARARSASDARSVPVPPEVKAIRDQMVKARADWQKHREAMRPLRRQAYILKLELKILMLRAKLDKKAILAKVKQIADLKGKIMAKRVFFRLAMKKKYPALARFRGFRGRGWRGRGGRGPCFRGGGPRGWSGGRFRGRGFRGGPGFKRGGPGFRRGGPGFRRGGPGPMRGGQGPMPGGPGPMM